jgi:hypothetical protein
MTVAKLAIYRGDTLEREVDLGPRNVRIGRSDQNDIVLADPGKSVSRFHAELRFEQGRYSIVDLNSQNGIWVAGARVQQAVLEPGVPVTLGTCRLVLRDAPATVAAHAAPQQAAVPPVATPAVPPATPPAVPSPPAVAPPSAAPAPAGTRVPEAPKPGAPGPGTAPRALAPAMPVPPRAAAPRTAPSVQARPAPAPQGSSRFIWIGLLVVLALAAMAAAIIFWPVG